MTNISDIDTVTDEDFDLDSIDAEALLAKLFGPRPEPENVNLEDPDGLVATLATTEAAVSFLPSLNNILKVLVMGRTLDPVPAECDTVMKLDGRAIADCAVVLSAAVANLNAFVQHHGLQASTPEEFASSGWNREDDAPLAIFDAFGERYGKTGVAVHIPVGGPSDIGIPDHFAVDGAWERGALNIGPTSF